MSRGAVLVAALRVDVRSTLIDVMRVIDRTGLGVALVTDTAGRLVDTITDGDLRRSFLSGLDANSQVERLLVAKRAGGATGPLTAVSGTEPSGILRLMRAHKIRQIPIVDSDRFVVDLVSIDDLFATDVLPLQAVVMAGGEGKRLRPLTNEVPKPMLRVGDRPIIERTVEQLRAAGIRRLSITTHYKPEAIEAHFGDGTFFGIEISYVNEKEPLGTAGSLGLLRPGTEPILVLNGDIIANVNFRAMLEFHQAHRATMTVGIRPFDIEVPFGVVDTSGSVVRGFSEKPRVSLEINAGVYLLEPRVISMLRSGVHCDMPDLIQRLLDAHESVMAYELEGVWLDIGQPEDYRRAGIVLGDSGVSS